jgi:hypothetical protein
MEIMFASSRIVAKETVLRTVLWILEGEVGHPSDPLPQNWKLCIAINVDDYNLLEIIQMNEPQGTQSASVPRSSVTRYARDNVFRSTLRQHPKSCQASPAVFIIQ